MGAYTNAVLLETDYHYNQFGFNIRDDGCCRVNSFAAVSNMFADIKWSDTKNSCFGTSLMLKEGYECMLSNLQNSDLGILNACRSKQVVIRVTNKWLHQRQWHQKMELLLMYSILRIATHHSVLKVTPSSDYFLVTQADNRYDLKCFLLSKVIKDGEWNFCCRKQTAF